MKYTHLLSILAVGLFTVSAQAALHDRGNGMIYDDVLNITWLQDANYAQTSGYDVDGKMTWQDANTWAANLTYGGFDDWRLASVNQMIAVPCNANDGSCDRGYNNTTSELGHMFYNNLGNLGHVDINGVNQPSFGVINSSFIDASNGVSVNILNFLNYVYWYGDEYANDPVLAWAFVAYDGYQDLNYKDNSHYSWAVRSGDVGQVPVPSAVWLLGTALLGLLGVKRRHR